MTKLSLTIEGTTTTLMKCLAAMSSAIDPELDADSAPTHSLTTAAEESDEEAATAAPAHPLTADADADRMPYDAAIHSDPPSLTDKGTWRVKRGMAKQAEDARAKWKAQGGAVVPPTSALPTAAVAPAMPGLPGMDAPKPNIIEAMYPKAAEPVLPPPVTVEDFLATVTSVVNEGKIAGEVLQGLYAKHGVTTMAALESNESLRRALRDDILATAGA